MSGPDPRGHLAFLDRQLRNCTVCPRMCRHACPVASAERDEAVTPQEKNTLARLVARSERALDADAADVLYACAGCRLCQTFCEHENDLAGSLFAARALAVEAGAAPEAVTELQRRWDESGNQYGRPLAERLAQLPTHRRVGADGPVARERRELPRAPGRGVRLYWPGCSTLEHRPELVDRTLAVMDRLGEADLVVFDGELQCCGYPMLATGDLSRFAERARALSERLAGVDAIFTAAPECAWTMGVAWKRAAGVEAPAPVRPVVDLLLEALDRAPTRAPVALDAVWHDPCYLGRFLGRYDEPRELLRRLLGHEVAEVQPWTREASYCCGGGGGLPWTRPETAAAMARTRVADLTGSASGPPGEAPAGERVVVTHCPGCEAALRGAGAQTRDLVDVVAAYLGLGPETEG